MNSLNKHITLTEVDSCPRCHQNDFMLISAYSKEAVAIDRTITTGFRDIFCTSCNLKILEVLEIGVD